MPEQQQHVVSKVLLKRWAVNGQLSAYNVRNRSVRERSPRAEGFIAGFTKVDPAGHEARWGLIETRMPPVFDALDQGVLFDDPTAVDTLKDFLALHFARSRTMRGVHRVATKGTIEKLIEDSEVLKDPSKVAEQLVNLTGLNPAGHDAQKVVRDAYAVRAHEVFGDGGEFFGERVEAVFTQFRAGLDGCGLEIGIADAGEFVMGDDPVQTAHAKSGVVGVLSGVTVTDADVVVLPLGPRHIVSRYARNEILRIPAHGVNKLNRIQIITAHEKVYFRRGANCAAAIAAELDAR